MQRSKAMMATTTISSIKVNPRIALLPRQRRLRDLSIGNLLRTVNGIELETRRGTSSSHELIVKACPRLHRSALRTKLITLPARRGVFFDPKVSRCKKHEPAPGAAGGERGGSRSASRWGCGRRECSAVQPVAAGRASASGARSRGDGRAHGGAAAPPAGHPRNQDGQTPLEALPGSRFRRV